MNIRRHFVAYWWVWLLIAAIVVGANEVVDRNFFDHREHIDGDIVIAVVIVLVAFFGSYLAARLKSRGAAPTRS